MLMIVYTSFYIREFTWALQLEAAIGVGVIATVSIVTVETVADGVVGFIIISQACR